MKKFVAILLVVMPIFLLVAVSVAGIVIAQLVHIRVESVAFINESEEEITSIKIEKGEELQLMYKILPLQASDQKVKFMTSKPDKVTITEDGLVTGVEYGMSTITVTTRDGAKTAQVLVEVTDERVSSVTLSKNEATLRVGEQITLTALVLPTSALNKNRTWSSSNESVAKVDASGRVQAVGEGVATITVTTVDGGKTDECVVTVTSDAPILAFNVGGTTIYKSSEKSVDMRDIIIHHGEVSFEEIDFKIVAGSVNASLSDAVLTFLGQGKIVRVVAEVEYGGDIYEATMDFVWIIA